MNNIYSFLSNVWKEIQEENKQNKAFIPFVLLLITLPISMAVNNVLLVVFFVSSLFYVGKKKLVWSITFFTPIFLFFWMSISYFWSIDLKRTLIAIPKEIALFLIPIAFMLVPPFTKKGKEKILKYYSYTMLGYVVYFFIRACIRFFIIKETTVFFYHGPDNETDIGLVPRLLNAIHVSVFVSIAFFYFFIKENKSKIDYFFSLLLFIFVILLSSKNIIIIFILLILVQISFYSKLANRFRLRNLFLLFLVLGLLLSFSKIKERFLIEFRSNTEKSITHSVGLNNNNNDEVNNISIYDAWNKEQFTHNDYFPGTAFRVYQIRMFVEFLKEESIFFKGFGLNASQKKLLEKEKFYNLYPGYGDYNFHNQYVQNFAELGVIGFLLLVIILFTNLKNALISKDFIHIAFGILMISLFLTESFLWRQRGVLFFMLFYCLYNVTSNFRLEKK